VIWGPTDDVSGVSAVKDLLFELLGRGSIDRIGLRRIVLCHHRRARVEVRGCADNLSRLRLAHSELARHAVDAAGLRKLRFGQAKLAILLAQLIAHLLL
jgi:uncharacterized sporulation protein YeaH/YhbH (DUF444 family)